MTTIKELEKAVERYRAEEIKTAQALRDSIAPIWTDAYGSTQSRGINGLTFEVFIAGVLDTLPINNNRLDDK